MISEFKIERSFGMNMDAVNGEKAVKDMNTLRPFILTFVNRPR